MRDDMAEIDELRSTNAEQAASLIIDHCYLRATPGAAAIRAVHGSSTAVVRSFDDTLENRDVAAQGDRSRPPLIGGG